MPSTDSAYNASLLDLDQRDIEGELKRGDFVSAKRLYEGGRNSFRPNGELRTIASLGTSPDELRGEELFDLYVDYFEGDDQYGHSFVLEGLDGIGLLAAAEDAARDQVVKKGTQYLITEMYIWHKLSQSEQLCWDEEKEKEEEEEEENGGSSSPPATTASAALAAWDEAYALYAGSQVGLTSEAHKGIGYQSFALAEKRAPQFATTALDSSLTKSWQQSQVNTELVEIFTVGSQLLANRSCTTLSVLVQRIKTLMLIPLIQGTLRYVYRCDPSKVSIHDSNTCSEKERAELWTFAASVLPLVNRCSAEAAALVRRNSEFRPGTNPGTTVKDGFAEVFHAFQSTYTCLGITCEEVGSVLDPTSTPPEFSPYPGAGVNECRRLQDHLRNQPLSSFVTSPSPLTGQTSSSSSTLSGGAIAGIVLGVVATMALVTIAVVLLHHKARARRFGTRGADVKLPLPSMAPAPTSSSSPASSSTTNL